MSRLIARPTPQADAPAPPVADPPRSVLAETEATIATIRDAVHRLEAVEQDAMSARLRNQSRIYQFSARAVTVEPEDLPMLARQQDDALGERDYHQSLASAIATRKERYRRDLDTAEAHLRNLHQATIPSQRRLIEESRRELATAERNLNEAQHRREVFARQTAYTREHFKPSREQPRCREAFQLSQHDAEVEAMERRLASARKTLSARLLGLQNLTGEDVSLLQNNAEQR